MKMKKLAIASAVSAAMSVGAAFPAFAAVTGLPGEALLVPLVLNDPEEEDDDTNPATDLHTYVNIRVPFTLGQDFVLNTYTAPNVTDGSTITQGDRLELLEIHWTAYTHKSVKIQDGTCYVSPGDSVMWSTDEDFVDEQAEPRGDDGGADDPGDNGILRECGPVGGLGLRGTDGYIGYVIFQTYEGARGASADFAIEGEAWILDDQVIAEAGNGFSILAVPVVPMADGEDTNVVGGQTVGPPQLGLNEVINGRSVDTVGEGLPSDPTSYAPLAAGIRMNNGDGVISNVFFAGPVQGAEGAFDEDRNAGVSLHVTWFDRNDPFRVSFGNLWDEDERPCSFPLDLPWQVNVYAFNLDIDFNRVQARPEFPWRTIQLNHDDESDANVVADINQAVAQAVANRGYESPDYQCEPRGWEYTQMGYYEYRIDEAADNDGEVTSAAVAFTAQEDDEENTAWGGGQMMSARGFQ